MSGCMRTLVKYKFIFQARRRRRRRRRYKCRMHNVQRYFMHRMKWMRFGSNGCSVATANTKNSKCGAQHFREIKLKLPRYSNPFWRCLEFAPTHERGRPSMFDGLHRRPGNKYLIKYCWSDATKCAAGISEFSIVRHRSERFLLRLKQWIPWRIRNSYSPFMNAKNCKFQGRNWF